jgi:hypothetical protein
MVLVPFGYVVEVTEVCWMDLLHQLQWSSN